MIRPIFVLLGLITCLVAGVLWMVRQQEPHHAPWIAYQAYRDNNWDIYLMNPESNRVRRLTDHPQNDQFPMWSPDGKHIVFFADRDGTDAVYRLAVRGGDVQRLTPEGVLARHPAYSSDGQWITFAAQIGEQWGVYRIPASRNTSTEMELLTENESKVDYLVYSPNGEWIAFVANRDGDRDLFLMRADGSEERQLTDTFYNEWGAVWLDNDWLGYATDRNLREDLYAINIHDLSEKAILQSTPDETLATWSPDGTRMVYVSWGDRTADLFLSREDNHFVERLTFREGRHWAPMWSPIIELSWRAGFLWMLGLGLLAVTWLIKPTDKLPASFRRYRAN